MDRPCLVNSYPPFNFFFTLWKGLSLNFEVQFLFATKRNHIGWELDHLLGKFHKIIPKKRRLIDWNDSYLLLPMYQVRYADCFRLMCI